MRNLWLVVLAIVFVPVSHPPLGEAGYAPSTVQLPVIVLPADPAMLDDWAAVNHFTAALREQDVDVVDFAAPGELALEVVVQCVRNAGGRFHIVTAAMSYLRELPDDVESRTRPVLTMNTGSGELEDVVRTLADGVFDVLATGTH